MVERIVFVRVVGKSFAKAKECEIAQYLIEAGAKSLGQMFVRFGLHGKSLLQKQLLYWPSYLSYDSIEMIVCTNIYPLPTNVVKEKMPMFTSSVMALASFEELLFASVVDEKQPCVGDGLTIDDSLYFELER